MSAPQPLGASDERPPRGPAMPAILRLLRVGTAIALLAALAADFLGERGEARGLAESFGFPAWFGFAASVLLVVAAKGVGRFLKRPEDHLGD